VDASHFGRVASAVDVLAVDTHSALFKYQTHFLVWFVPIKVPLPDAHEIVNLVPAML